MAILRAWAVVVASVALAGCGTGGFGLGGSDNGPPSPYAQQYLDQYNAIDTAHKGVITIDQASAYYDHRFAELDLNHDNVLDANELAPMVPIMNSKTGADVVSALDRNNDGKVTAAEFQVITNWLFQRAYKASELTLEEARRGTYRPPAGKPKEAPSDKLPPNR